MKRLSALLVTLLVLSSAAAAFGETPTQDRNVADGAQPRWSVDSRSQGLVHDRLDGVESWAFAIGTGQLRRRSLQRLRNFDLVIVDGEEASARKIGRLQRSDTIVLAYLSVGTIEKGRDWFEQAKPYRLELWGDWGEWYADVSNTEFRALLVDEVAAAMLDKGFDGLFLDNVDMIDGHEAQAEGMALLVAELRALVGPDRLLFAQNGEAVLGPMLEHLDGWNREDVSATYDFDSERYRRVGRAERRRNLKAIRRMRAAGLFVTTTDYTARGTSRRALKAARRACAKGALPYVADIFLKRQPEPLRCT